MFKNFVNKVMIFVLLLLLLLLFLCRRVQLENFENTSEINP